MTGPRLRCVVVDDHALLRLGLRTALTARGHAVVAEFESGDALIAAIDSLKRIDLVITDARMPNGDGFFVCRTVKLAWPIVAIAMLTSYDDEATRARALAAGVNAFVAKDEDAEALVEHLIEAVQDPLAAPEVGSDVPFSLTVRELEVIQQLVYGLTNREVAEALGISPETVKDYVHQVYGKLGVSDRASLTRVALEHRLTS